MSGNIETFVTWLRSRERRLDLSDQELVDLCWRVHPRFQFFKLLPWGANLIDLGAGHGGSALWKAWLTPERPDLNLYGVDRNIGEHADLYAGWETIDFDRQMPNFPAVKLDAFLASHLLEYLETPAALIEWLATRAEPGARAYLEWTSPSSLDLPTREQLQKYGIDIVISNFTDDWEHKQAPDLAVLSGWLTASGFELISSGAIDLGVLGEELFARGMDRDHRSMGYWSMTRSSLYAVAIKSATAARGPGGSIGTSTALAERARPPAAAKALPSEDLALLRTKRALLVSGLFDAAFYRETYADMGATTADPLTHYITQGEAEGRSPNPVFFPRYYRRRWMAGAPAERNVLAHYAEEGERQGHKPHPAFDPQAYLAANPPLAEFVDRPLFHYLQIGRAAGLPVAPGPRGEKLARVIEAQPHAADFEYSGRRNHYQLMRYKQALVRELGIAEGFACYKEMFDLPDSDRIDQKPLASLYEFAKQHAAAFHEIDPGGERFTIRPPHVIGEGNHKPLAGVSRAIFVACLINAAVRARSGFIEAVDAALLDYQGDELSRIDDELDFDPAVFHAADGAVWMIGPENETAAIEFDEAFMLLGPHSDGFGHWMLDLLPRYLAASASGALPPVPVLIDEGMAATQRECLELMLPEGVEVIALPSHATAQVRRLWCAPSQMHWSVQAKINERWKWDYQGAPLSRFAKVIHEIMRRIEPVTRGATRQDRIYLARRPGSRHALVNAAEIEAAARARGFLVVYPEDLSFLEQARLVRNARFIVGPEGSQLLLAWFSQPGTKLCHLCHPYTAELPLQSGLLDEIGIAVTVLTGPYVAVNLEYPEQSDYRIDVRDFCDFLDSWLDRQPRHRGPIAGAANVFSYWDKPDLTPIQPFIDEWRSHFLDFTILGDPNIEPLIEELFPQHLEMYRKIRIPTAKSDVALLLALYKYGGLHIDAHCGVRDAAAIQELLNSLDRWEVILYDKDRQAEPRPTSQIYPINSVLFARQRSPIILETARTVFDNLARHWAAEKERGFHPYDIWLLTLPGSLHPTLLVDPEAAVSRVKPAYVRRVRFLQEGPGEPIGRYMNHSYRNPDMHWSVRQEHELLFEPSDAVASRPRSQLAPMPQRSTLKLFVAIYNDAQLLENFLSHYTKLGITEFFIAVAESFKDEVAKFASSYNITCYPNLDVSDTNIGMVSAVTEMRERHQGPGEWVIIVDLDEFVEVPGDIHRVIAVAEDEHTNVIRGIMWDRFAPDGRVTGFVPGSDLKSIYPVKARFIRDVTGGADYKGVLVKGLLKSRSAHHNFANEIISSVKLEISHYKWTAGAIDRVRAAHQMLVDAGKPWAFEYARILEHYQPYGRFAWETFGGMLDNGPLSASHGYNKATHDNRLRVIVLGFLVREPSAHAWHYTNYVQGLAQLGHDVYYIEDSDDIPMCLDDQLRGPTTDATYGLTFASMVFDRLGMANRWAYYDAHRKEWRGPRAGDAKLLCQTADVLINISGVNPIREWLAAVPVRVMIDTDPGFTQILNLTDPGFRDRCKAHTAFFSFGENIGRATCRVPVDGFYWRATRQPLALNLWPLTPGKRDGRFTTVMQWESFPVPYQFGGLRLAMKSESFRRFMQLPRRLGDIFCLAVRAEAQTLSALHEAGWGIAEIDNVSRDPWDYQAFIQTSKAEFGIAKAGYIETRCGWFSERSACYLASGRPVLHQDTGFGDQLPTGEGLIPFRSPDDVADAVERVSANYEAHCRAAREIALEYFAADRVLSSLFDAALAPGEIPSQTNTPREG